MCEKSIHMVYSLNSASKEGDDGASTNICFFDFFFLKHTGKQDCFKSPGLGHGKTNHRSVFFNSVIY